MLNGSCEKADRQTIYADTADGKIISVTLSGPNGFEGKGGVLLSADAIQALASYYEVWLLNSQPPKGLLKKKIAQATYLARKLIGIDGRNYLGLVERDFTDQPPISMKVELPAHVSEFIFENLANLSASVQSVDIPNFPGEKISTKRISTAQFRLTANKREATNEYKATLETWQNARAYDGMVVKVVEGSGDFAKALHGAIFSSFLPIDPSVEVVAGEENVRGKIALDNYRDFQLMFNKTDEGVSFHLEYAPEGLPASSLASAYERNGDPGRSVSEPDRSRSRRHYDLPERDINRVYNQGSSRIYRGLDGVSREAVRDPTGP